MVHLEFCPDMQAAEWAMLLKDMQNVPVSQSWGWGKASSLCYGYHPLYFVIKKNKKIIGCFLVLRKGFLKDFIVIQKGIRGPVFSKNIAQNDKIESLKIIRDYFPRGLLKIFSLQPNLTSEEVALISLDHSFKKTRLASYESQILDLMKSKEELWREMKLSWRKSLGSSQRFKFKICEMGGDDRKIFFESYNSFRKNRSFHAPSGDFYQSLQVSDQNSFSCLGVYEEGTKPPLASAFISMVGDTVTYLAGLVSEKGRKKCANHSLLWALILKAQEEGFCSFDLGGIKMPQSQNIDRFKQRMGGKKYKLAGSYV